MTSYSNKDRIDDKSPSLDWESPTPHEIRSSSALLESTSILDSTIQLSANITLTNSSKDDGKFDLTFSSAAPDELAKCLPPPTAASPDAHKISTLQTPPLNIVIQVVGSRGDVQPFIALGTALQKYGHRVRLATHDVFEKFVRNSGLDFYPIGGDPEDLMSYMVRNPGLLPSLKSLRGGDISRKRRMIHDILAGCWKSCVSRDPVTHQPFVANAIIATPPSFAHVHCAQALGVPVHMMFTMPWTATRAFPHPLTRVQCRDMSESTANYLSYGIVDLMTWEGLGDVINRWRVKDLLLDPVSPSMGPDLVNFLEIPYTYCWSPALVPKPKDWGNNTDICGFFMRQEPEYTPDDELANFLSTGPVPIYVGFGSIVLENADRMSKIILEACKAAKVRAIISRGWSRLGGNDANTEDVLYLGDCPHEWLFKRVSVVVHHGGAGTTACGLYNACPTVIVPFFGDQPFWGNVVASYGAGSAPIHHKSLNSENLAEAIRLCLTENTRISTQSLADRMRAEDGVTSAVESFHRQLRNVDLACDMLPQHAADWYYKSPKSKLNMKLSHYAFNVLLKEKKLKRTDVTPYRPKEYSTDVTRWDPLTAGCASTLGVVTDFTSALGGTFIDPFREYKRSRASGQGGKSASALAAGKGFASIGTTLTKGTLVDVPLALAEGLRNTPRLYGDEVKDHGKVTDWKSGGVVMAKNFGTGFYEGVTDIVTKPYAGAKEEGALGFMKGLGRGSLNLVAKPGSAMFGVLAYPAQGIYKSIKNAGMSTVQDQIAASKFESSERWNTSCERVAAEKVLSMFERAMST